MVSKTNVMRICALAFLLAIIIWPDVDLVFELAVLVAVLFEIVFEWEAERGVLGLMFVGLLFAVASYASFAESQPISGSLRALITVLNCVLIIGEFIKRAQARKRYPMGHD